MASTTRFVANRAGMNQLLRGRNGPVVLHLANVGRQAAAGVRRAAPRGRGPGPHIAENINSELVPASKGFAVHIVADVPHAIYVVKGTRPHSIGSPVFIDGVGWRYIGLSPRGAGRVHPGTAPNDFMSRGVEQATGLRVRRVA